MSNHLGELIRIVYKKLVPDVLRNKIRAMRPHITTQSQNDFYAPKKEMSPLDAINELRNFWRTQYKNAYPHSFIHIDDFTFGMPIIRFWNDKWNNEISLNIGRFCSIADGVQIVLGGEHSIDWITTYPFHAFFDFCKANEADFLRNGDKIIIGNDVWIGGDAKIMSGVVIGNGCVIGANTLITRNKKIPDYTIWAGIPAKQIGQRFNAATVAKLNEIQWWNWSDEDIFNVMPILYTNDVEKLIGYYETHIRFQTNGEEK